MKKKIEPPESMASVRVVHPSTLYNLFLATGDDNFACCFCGDRIVSRDIYKLLAMPKGYRRAHERCVTRVLCGVIGLRDRNGKSEDLPKRTNKTGSQEASV